MGELFPILFFVVFGVIVVTFVIIIVRMMLEWHKNNKAPRLTVDAKVVSRRTQVGRSAHVHHSHIDGGAAMHHSSYHTRYFATFEVESGDRMELPLDGRDYALIVEGDRGRLTFQGTRFIQFDRV